MSTVTELCRLSLDHAPTATALIAGDECWTYGSLNDAVRSLAAVMGRDRLAGERVAMMLPNGSDAVLTYLACFASGAVAAPLNSRYAAPEVEHALRRARPRWLECTRRLGTLGAVDPTALDGVRAQVLRVPGVDRATFASLRGMYTGGDSVPGALQREFKALTGLPIGVGWGMTEAIWLTIAREPPIDRDGCIGVPVGGAEIRADARPPSCSYADRW